MTRRDWGERYLLLSGSERRRVLPFFLLYLLLFAALTIAEGLSVSLFVKRVGASELPLWYGAMAIANLVLVGGYVVIAQRWSSDTLFRLIVGLCGAAFLGVWAILQVSEASVPVLGTLFVAREIAYTLFLMHFGTYLQDFFSREELNRVMPIVYAGGRVGGIAGGWGLSNLSGALGLESFLLVCAALALVAAASTWVIGRRVARTDTALDDRGAAGLAGGAGLSADELERMAQSSWRGLIFFLWNSPLARWNTILSFVYVGCRWFLNFQYNTFFEGHFDSEIAMAEFLGLYAQIALGLSLVMQLFVVGRAVARFGLHAAQIGYAVLLASGFIGNMVAPGLPAAVWSRFLESELRFGLRNPINQMILNKFSKAIRIRMRAWSIGVVIPVSTFGTAMLLQGLRATSSPLGFGLVGLGLGLGYLAASIRLTRTFSDRPSRSDRSESSG